MAAGLALSACSSVLDVFPEPAAKAPSLSAVTLDLKKVVTETKISEPIEVAGPYEADPVTVAPWIICLRSAAQDQGRPTYALFYRGLTLVTYRFSAIVDRCDEQAFKPL
jgi:hypothetical protein